jgi:hypothetical protein
MGYIHDTGLCVFLPPSLTQVADAVSAWSDQQSSSVWWRQRAAGAGAFTLKASILLPHKHTTLYKGSYLQSIDVWYRVLTAALTALDAYIWMQALPVNGAAFGAPTEKNFAYDSGHDTNLERSSAAVHKMTLSLNPAFWVEYDYFVNLEITATAPATTVFAYYGARANYTLRI